MLKKIKPIIFTSFLAALCLLPACGNVAQTSNRLHYALASSNERKRIDECFQPWKNLDDYKAGFMLDRILRDAVISSAEVTQKTKVRIYCGFDGHVVRVDPPSLGPRTRDALLSTRGPIGIRYGKPIRYYYSSYVSLGAHGYEFELANGAEDAEWITL